MDSPATPPPGAPVTSVPFEGFTNALFEQSPLSTVVYDGAGHVVLANAAFERLFGLRVADLPREYSVVEDPQLEAQGMLPLVRQAFAGEPSVLPLVRYTAVPALGVTTETWTQAHFYPLRDAAGAVTAVVLVHLDLTARVDAEEALRSSEARLRVALESGRLGAWEWVVPEGVVRWSATMELIHGLEPGTFGGTFDDFMRDAHPDDRARVLATIERALGGEPFDLEYRVVRPDGEVRWLGSRGQLLRDAQGAPLRLIGIGSDVTDARRAAEITRLLAEAGVALASSLDYERTLDTVARLAVPVLADYCVIDLLDAAAPGGMRRVATAHADPARDALIAAVREFPPSLDADGIVARTLRTGAPQLVSPIVDVAVVAAAERPAHEAILRELAPEAVLCVPLVAHDVTVGTMLLAVTGSGRRYSAEDVPAAAELARRAAVAVDNARLHRAALVARRASEEQAAELERQAVELQDQAAVLEAQQHELEEQIEEAASLTEELREANDAVERERATADAQRESAERAAREVEAILASISDPLVVYDADWRFRYINEAAREIFRLTGPAAGEPGLLGATVWDAYPDLRGSGFERTLLRAAAERTPVTSEEYHPRRGSWTEVRCFPMPDGALMTSWRDVTARKRAAEAEHYLGEATAILASSLDVEATLASLARLVVPQLADWCSVDLVEDGAIERVAVAHVDPEKVRWADEINRRYPVQAVAPTGVPNVIRTGAPEMVSDVTDELLEASVDDPEYLAMLRAVGLRSVIIVPLVAGGRTFGALSLVAAESGRRYDEADLQLASELARRAALAVENARLHQAALASERRAAAHAAGVERFRRAQESSPDAFALFDAVRDLDGRVVDFVWNWANAAALRVQGAALDELRGRRMLERNPGLAGSPLFAGYVRALDTGVPYEDEVHYRHEWLDTWFRITAVPLDGGLALTFADVTARHRAERRSAALAELTRALASATTRGEVGAVVLDRVLPVLGLTAGSLIEYDAESEELSLVAERGFAAGAMRPWDRYALSDATPGADAIRSGELVIVASRDEWRARYPQHAAWAESAGIEGSAVLPLRVGDRTLGLVGLQSARARVFDADERQFLLAFADQCAQAIERVRLFEAERRAREELARVFAQAPVAIALTRGPGHVFQIANARYEALVGRAGLVGLSVREALPELGEQGIYELMDGVLRTGEPYVGTETPVWVARGRDGARELAYFTFVFQPVTLRGDAVDGVAVVASDVTPQVRARLDAERLREAAESANLSKTEFLASMSHELRTPLNAIGGYTDLMLLGVRGAITPDQRTDLERINRSQRHLLGVINDILNFARLEAGFVDYAPRAIPVADLMAEVEPLVLPQLGAKALAFTRDAGPAGLCVHADPEKGRQILLNLLANAIKFTDRGGRVWLTGAAAAGAVEIAVHDTGIGIPADRLASVFDPFVQVHRSLSRPVDGTGLGLSISRDLARGMGGDITVVSEPGRGSTFTLRLPRSVPNETA